MGIEQRLPWRPLAVLLVLLMAGPSMAAQKAVTDDAGFFSPAAVDQAETQLQQLQQQYHRVVTVETFADLPAELKGQVDGNDASKAQAYAAFAKSRAYSLGSDLYVGITKSPGHVETYARSTNRSGLTADGYNRLRQDLLGYFKAKQFDQGLTNLTASLAKTYENDANGPAATPARPAPSAVPPVAAPSDTSAGRSSGYPPANAPAKSTGLFGLGGCMTVVILFAIVFFVIRIIRGLFAPKYPPQLPPGGGNGPAGYGQQPGYGQGGYPPQQQSGGGFGRGMLGGVLGGLLGGYAGNQVFGQHNNPTNPGNSDPGAGGGNFGGDPGGGDLGAGGGDFGGGGDSGGGGGDSGGGGGDF